MKRGLQPATIVKYAKMLEDLRDYCQQAAPLKISELRRTYGISSNVMENLYKLDILVKDTSSLSGYCFKDKRNSTQIARELAHAAYKVAKAYYLNKDINTSKPVLTVTPQAPIEQAPLTPAPGVPTWSNTLVVPLSKKTQLHISPMDRKLLSLVLEDVTNPDLQAFAQRFNMLLQAS